MSFSEDFINQGLQQAEGDTAPAPAAPTPPPAAPAQQAAPSPPEGQPQVPAPPAEQAGAAPWAADLEALGLGEFGPKVDAYLREKWQPRMTEYEGIAKKYNEWFGGDEEAEAASAMLKAFMEDPVAAFYELGAGLGLTEDGEDATGYFDDGQEDQQVGQPEAQQPALDPRYQEFLDQQIAQQEQAQQQKLLDDYFDTVEKEYGEGFNRDLFHKLFIGSMGDEKAAKEAYSQFHNLSKLQQDQVAAQVPPPVLNENTGGPPNPTPEKPKTIDEAMQSWLADEKAKKAAAR